MVIRRTRINRVSRRPFVSKLERDALNHIAVFRNRSSQKKKLKNKGKTSLSQSTFPSLTEIRGKRVCGERVKRHVSAGKWIPSLRKDREGERGRGEGKKRSRRLIIHHEVKL